MVTSRRRFIKYLIGAGVLTAAGVYGIDQLLKGSEGQTPTTTTTTSSAITTTSTSTTQNAPLVVRDLNQEVTAYQSDLQTFTSGLYRDTMLQNAQNLRTALKDYKPQNRESGGQAKRLDQLALSGLLLYSWASRLQQDDVKMVTDQRFNPPDVMPASSRISELLGLEISPPEEYMSNVGKFQTDISTEHFITPYLRPEIAALYNALDSNVRAQLKQAFESYEPTTGSIQDYKQISEEHIWLTSTNGWLKWLFDTPGDVYRKDVKTVFESGLSRNSSLGRISNSAYDMLPRRFFAERDGYSQYIDSVLGELSSNHRELSDHDFALAVMKSPTIIELGKQVKNCCGMPDINYDYMDATLQAALLLDGRQPYIVAEFDPSNSSFNGYYYFGVKFNGAYYQPWFRSKFVPDGPLLTDIADKRTGYGGFHRGWYYSVTKSILDYWNAIPVFVYNPNKGIVINLE